MNDSYDGPDTNDTDEVNNTDSTESETISPFASDDEEAADTGASEEVSPGGRGGSSGSNEGLSGGIEGSTGSKEGISGGREGSPGSKEGLSGGIEGPQGSKEGIPEEKDSSGKDTEHHVSGKISLEMQGKEALPSENDKVLKGTVKREEVQSKDIQNKDVQNRDAQDKNIQNRDVQDKDVQNRDVQNKDVQNKDIKTDESMRQESGRNVYAPQSRIEINGHLFRTDDNGKIHMYYDKNEKQWCMMPNTEYTSKGYHYRTNENGDIVHVEGKLRTTDEERKPLSDKVEGMKEGDQRGHIIADRFDASNRRDNLFPQLGEVNQGDYKALENSLAKAVEDKKDVQVSYELRYLDGNRSHRPDQVVVNYTIDGEPGEAVFDNRG